MTVGVLHDRIPPKPSRDELDTLVQAEAVSRALADLGHVPADVEFHYDIDAVIESLGRLSPGIVFNLAESPSGRGRFISFAPLVLEHLKIPYTGCPAGAVFLTSDKILAKRLLSLAGIPTPPWLTLDDRGNAAGTGIGGTGGSCSGRFIFKSVWEHASIGLDEGSVADVVSVEELGRLLEVKNGVSKGAVFAERYVEGREFNISLLGGARRGGSRPDVLAPAEMNFASRQDGAPRILGYRAKWDEGSREYASTVRSFDFGADDASLLEELRGISLRCWDLFGLKGYARVDFRVDGEGMPFVLEINANPCIAPDSGFVAAAAKSGLSFRDVVGRILECAAGGRS